MKTALWRAMIGLAMAGSLVVTPPAVGYAVEALRAEPGVASNGAVTDLRRHDNEHAKHYRDQQPPEPFARELSPTPPPQRERHAAPGNEEQERQPPTIEEEHR